jgi:hypothetical protein
MVRSLAVKRTFASVAHFILKGSILLPWYTMVPVMLYLLRANAVSWEYEVLGYINVNRKIEKYRFDVTVRDASWCIRVYTGKPQANEARIYLESGSTNNTEIYHLTRSSARENKGDALNELPQGEKKKMPSIKRRHSMATIISNAVPTDSGNACIGHLWFMLASHGYFETLKTHGSLPPTYDPVCSVQLDKGLVLPCSWNRTTALPMLPSSIVFYNDGFWHVMDTNNVPKAIKVRPPYEQGFTNAIYSVKGYTNVAGLLLPKSFIFEEYMPSPKGRTKDDLEVSTRVEVIITDWKGSCSKNMLLPLPPENCVVIDRRLAHDNEPIGSIAYNAPKNRWYSVQEAKRIYKSKDLRRGYWHLMVWFGLFLLPILLFFWQQRLKRSG